MTRNDFSCAYGKRNEKQSEIKACAELVEDAVHMRGEICARESYCERLTCSYPRMIKYPILISYQKC